MLAAVASVIYKRILSAFCLLYLGSSNVASARDVHGLCRGAALPSGQIRHLRNLRLECTSNSDRYSRSFSAPSITDQWKDLQEESLNVDAGMRTTVRREMQALRQQEPLIRNSGVIPYETVEVWEWTESVYGPHPSCGYKLETVCKKSLYETETVCTEEMVVQTCVHDEDRTSERFCSNETLTYQAEFVRPSEREWNPETPGYLDILPNKYDLFPGEKEEVTVHSNYRRNRTLTPLLSVKKPRNDYQTLIQFQGTRLSSMACEVDSPKSLDIKIYTSHRLTQSQSPNAFVKGQDADQFEISPIRWLYSVNKNGRVVPTRPDSLVLRDEGAELAEMFSKETRHGELNPSWKTFYKNTIIRLRLVQRGLNLWKSRKIYLRSNQISIDEFGNHVFPLHQDGNNLFSRKAGFFGNLKNWFKVALQANKSYTLYVSVYQKDMPFYAQACDESSSYFCRLFNWESKYYSEEIPIDFETADRIDYKKLMKNITEVVEK